MQTMHWDKSQLHKEFANYNNLGELIRELEHRFELDGKVICEIHVNGMFLSEQDEAQFAGELVKDLKSLRIVTKSPQQLLEAALTSHAEFCQELSLSAITLAEKARHRSDENIHLHLRRFFDSCQWLISALQVLKGQSTKFEITEEWRELEARIAKIFKELLDAFAKEDIYLVSDILEYDLSVSLEQWGLVLRRVNKIVNNLEKNC